MVVSKVWEFCCFVESVISVLREFTAKPINQTLSCFLNLYVSGSTRKQAAMSTNISRSYSLGRRSVHEDKLLLLEREVCLFPVRQ